jgi:predicted RND superfamily exporter protein
MKINEKNLFLIQYSRIVLICLGCLLVFSVFFIPGIKSVFNLRDFLIKNDPDLTFYEEFEKEFDFESEMLLIGIYREPSIFDYEFLNQLKNFTRACNDLKLVDRAYSLATLKDYIDSPFGLTSFPFLHIDNPERYDSDSTKISRDERLVGWMISNDSKTATVVVHAEKYLDEGLQGKLISSLDSLINISPLDKIHMAGNMNTEIKYVRMIDNELALNTLLCSIIIILCLIFIFRSAAGVIIPSVTVISSMLIFFGLFGFFHRSFNLLSTLFPTIILIVGISDVIHFLTKYQYSLNLNIERKTAIGMSFKELLMPMFITSLTTAIGFFSLITATIQPIRSFGIVSGIGVMLTFLITFLFVPTILLYIKQERFISKRQSDKNWKLLFGKINYLTSQHKNKVIIITLLLLSVSFIGVLMINSNNKLIDFFSKQSKIKNDFLFFEEQLSGIRSLKLAILPATNRKINDPEVLAQIEKLHNHINTLPETGIVFSPATQYKTMNKVYHRGALNEYRLPKTKAEVDKLDKYFRAYKSQQFRLVNNELTKGLISAQIRDIGSQKMEQLDASMNKWINENIDSEKVSIRQTGISYLTDKSNNSLKRNMLISLMFAFLVVSLIMVFLFKHINFLLISLVPNIIPLIVAGGVMGFSGLVFNASTAVVFTIGFVIAVDNTIHFFSRFWIELKTSTDINEAILATFHKAGKAITLTSIILLLGFLMLLRSEMEGVYAQGVLFSSIIVSALFGDLFLLPVLIRKFFKFRS